MNWQRDIESAETMLHASRIPSSLEIITLIKRVNPTKLCLSEQGNEAERRQQKGVRVAVQIKDQPHVAKCRASCDPDRS